jgi:hypothetical protein
VLDQTDELALSLFLLSRVDLFSRVDLSSRVDLDGARPT